jgi:hypothetical protein
MRGIRDTMTDIVEAYAEESPGFPAMNDPTRAITRVAAQADGFLPAMSIERTSPGLAEGL